MSYKKYYKILGFFKFTEYIGLKPLPRLCLKRNPLDLLDFSASPSVV